MTPGPLRTKPQTVTLLHTVTLCEAIITEPLNMLISNRLVREGPLEEGGRALSPLPSPGPLALVCHCVDQGHLHEYKIFNY